MILIILGVLSLLYYIGIIIYAGLNASFSKIWILVSIVCFLLFYIINYKSNIIEMIKDNTILKWGICVLLLVGVGSFLLVEGFVINGMLQKGEPELEYIIILGAGVSGEQPSRVLNERIKTAANYLEENPTTIVILSGGQGEGENISEAEAMRRALLNLGIDESRMMLENQSVNTQQNIEFSFRMMDNQDARVGIVTSNFHVFRAVSIVKKQGHSNIVGIAASVDLGIVPHYMLRECFAIIKEKLVGNM